LYVTSLIRRINKWCRTSGIIAQKIASNSFTGEVNTRDFSAYRIINTRVYGSTSKHPETTGQNNVD